MFRMKVVSSLRIFSSEFRMPESSTVGLSVSGPTTPQHHLGRRPCRAKPPTRDECYRLQSFALLDRSKLDRAKSDPTRERSVVLICSPDAVSCPRVDRIATCRPWK